jgi:phosphohistidine phosphatase
MRLYIVRHGEAERQVSTDDARALTSRGRDDVAFLWEQLASRGVQPARLISSPYVRARQTADIIAARFPAAPIMELATITPEGDPAGTIAELESLGAADSWTLVSHMPFVDLLCGTLTDGRRYPFQVGAVACVDLEALQPGAGRLRWLLSPADVR